MKKIFDWTVGSFFRTIGRTIAFFAMAMLVYYLLSYNDIDFGIKNLFFDNVKASTTGISARWQGDMWNISGTKLNFGTFGFTDQFDASQGSGSQRTVRTFYFNNALSSSGGGLPIEDGKDYLSFRYTIWTPLITSTTNDFAVSFLFWTQNNWGGGANCEVISDSDVYLNNASKIVKMYVVKCPIINGSSAISNFNVSFNATSNILYYHELSGDILQYSSISVSDQQIINSINNQTQSVINNQNQNTQEIINATEHQTQQQQQQHQEMMDNNTTQAESDAFSFFGNFTVEDQGGLSAIVTAPLNTIRSLLSSTCADLVLPLPFVEEDLTLPCMYSIYTQHFGAFFSLYQTIILGIIAYRCIMSIFFDIKGFTNPNDDRIEVMDL